MCVCSCISEQAEAFRCTECMSMLNWAEQWNVHSTWPVALCVFGLALFNFEWGFFFFFPPNWLQNVLALLRRRITSTAESLELCLAKKKKSTCGETHRACVWAVEMNKGSRVVVVVVEWKVWAGTQAWNLSRGVAAAAKALANTRDSG